MSLLLHIIVTYIKENITAKLQKLYSLPRNPRAGNKSPALFVKKPLCTGDLSSARKIFIERPVTYWIFCDISTTINWIHFMSIFISIGELLLIINPPLFSSIIISSLRIKPSLITGTITIKGVFILKELSCISLSCFFIFSYVNSVIVAPACCYFSVVKLALFKTRYASTPDGKVISCLDIS